LKQLKGWAIVSRALNSLFTNLKASRVYLTEVVLSALTFALIYHYFIYPLSLTGIVLLIIFILVLLYFMGKIRTKELNNIINTISAIRDNKLLSVNEISLGKNLSTLQDEIKSMFLKSKTDIDNLKRLERVRTEFLGNVSHELRTPIFAIQGFLETLLDGALEDKNVNRSFLEKANHHTENLNHLLNDLIDISMIESGEMRMSFRYFNINELILTILNEQKPFAEHKGLTLDYDPVRENLKVFGDKNKLQQALVNLIQNAVKYTEEGNIRIIVTEQKQYAEICVEDTGIGIPEKDIERIFERFYRIDKDRSRAQGGSGLGLAIVKHIIEAHGSKVEVKSELGKGSQFIFRLKK